MEQACTIVLAFFYTALPGGFARAFIAQFPPGVLLTAAF